MTRVNTLNEIADIYLNNTEQSIIEENEKVGKHAAGAELEDEKKAKKEPTKDTGPESAENYDSKVNEAGGIGKRDEKNNFSTGKTSNESINTRDMSKRKSIFDKLYEDVLGGDDDELDMGMGMDDMDDMGGDEDEGLEDEVTLSLPRDLAERLLDALSGQLDDEEVEDIEDTEDLDDYGPEEDDMMQMQEGPDVQQLGDAGPTGGDIDKGGLKGKNNKVPGSGPAHKKGGGSGNGSLKGGNPEPTELGDKSGTLTGKNNKVGGKVRGKDQELMD